MSEHEKVRKKSKKRILSKYKVRYSKMIYYIIGRMFIFSLIRRYLHLSTDTPFISKIRTPFILLPTHRSALDPFIYYSFINQLLYFVISSAHFRNVFLRILLKLSGGIPKKKNTLDIKTIQKIWYVLKIKKRSLCIFAEGVNSWDGESQEIQEGTASLIKKSGLPVIFANTHGAYFSYPRWARVPKPLKVSVSFEQGLSIKQVKEMSKQEISEVISHAYQSNEFEKQKQLPVFISHSSKAEHVERVLFACPYCEQVQGLLSRGNMFSCTFCKHEWEVDALGSFHTKYSLVSPQSYYEDNGLSLDPVDKDMSTWNKWQKNFLPYYIDKKIDNEVLFKDDNCTLRYGVSRMSMTKGEGLLILTSTHMLFIPYLSKRGEKISFSVPVQSITGINVQNGEKLEWSLGKSLLTYQICSSQANSNMYKYMVALSYLQA